MPDEYDQTADQQFYPDTEYPDHFINLERSFSTPAEGLAGGIMWCDFGHDLRVFHNLSPVALEKLRQKLRDISGWSPDTGPRNGRV
jgi:hypothetical protein